MGNFRYRLGQLVKLHCRRWGLFTLTDGFVSRRTAVSAVLDCLWPTAMNWYFRAPLRAKLLYTSADNNPPSPVKITLYRVGNTLLALGYLLARVIRRQDDQFISNVEYVAGGLAIW